MKNYSKRKYLILVCFVFLLLGPGCASTHKTTTTETTMTYPADAEQKTTAPTSPSSTKPNDTLIEKKETTTTTTETQGEHAGVIATTVHVIGYIIALPFTILAGLFHIIF